METLKKKLESGSELEIWLADFPSGHALYKAVTREMSRYNLAEGTAENLAMIMTSSEDVDAALWPCMGKATYTGHGYEKKRITQEIFEKPEVRSDLVEIQREVLGYNLIPFSRAIGSLLIAALIKSISNLKSQST